MKVSWYTVLVGVLFLSLLQFIAGHGTITVPAMRDNPVVSGGWCPYCQGSQEFCKDVSNISNCVPPHPCWEATPGSTVSPRHFNQREFMKDPEGNFWIDQNGNKSNYTRTVWCPGKTYKINLYSHADHNGVYRWESQLGNPGDEKEELFRNFSNWRSYNNDPDTIYYNTDGKTKIPPGKCTTNQSPWTPNVASCRSETWAQWNLTIPKNMPIGNTIIRWIWYGGMLPNQTRVYGPEWALFVNCADIIVGDSSQCA